MRGKEIMRHIDSCLKRITPAYAGKSHKPCSAALQKRDHPRLCGEKRKLSRLLIFSLGSPPPMRGKGRHCQIKILCHGITPAYAGKRLCISELLTEGRDHPRLCGEKHYTPFGNFCQAGSPPPMRGKVCHWVKIPVDFGITPAYAGKSPQN